MLSADLADFFHVIMDLAITVDPDTFERYNNASEVGMSRQRYTDEFKTEAVK